MLNKGFGIEVEFTGISRLAVVRALEEFFQTQAEESIGSVDDTPYTLYKVTDFTGAQWTVMRDRSIRSEFLLENRPDDLVESMRVSDNGRVVRDLDDYKVELVSPVLTYESFSVLFSVLDRLRILGGLVNETTGIHIHIDAPGTNEELLHILQRFCLVQDEIVEKFAPDKYRLENYCKLFPWYVVEDFLNYDETMRTPDALGLYLAHLRKGVSSSHPHPEKYYAMNLSSVIKRKTIEFRYFNASLDKAEVNRMLDWVATFCYGASYTEVGVG